MNLKLKSLITEFLAENENNDDFELYNEAGLQHELGYYLRCQFVDSDYKLQFERNIGAIVPNSDSILKYKKEMDLFIFEGEKKEKYCIELKYPPNEFYKKRIYHSFIDINFLEKLKLDAKFTKVALFFMTPLFDFMNPDKSLDGIYKYFRHLLKICQPTTDEEKTLVNMKGYKKLNINGSYKIEWQTFRENYYFFIIEF